MKPVYVTVGAGVPKIVPLDTNVDVFNVSIRTDATTVEVAVERPGDETATNGFDLPILPYAVAWVAAPAAGANGVIVLKDPYAAVRFSKVAAGFATVVQQGTA